MRPQTGPDQGRHMSIILQDPVHFETPTRSLVRPAAPLGPRTVSVERKVSFEVESRGGYRRSVTGTIAYLDDEAQTYVVLTSDGALIRVPLRDIKKTIESVASGPWTQPPESELNR
jgi:hypothetical protein